MHSFTRMRISLASKRARIWWDFHIRSSSSSRRCLRVREQEGEVSKNSVTHCNDYQSGFVQFWGRDQLQSSQKKPPLRLPHPLPPAPGSTRGGEAGEVSK